MTETAGKESVVTVSKKEQHSERSGQEWSIGAAEYEAYRNKHRHQMHGELSISHAEFFLDFSVDDKRDDASCDARS